MKIKLIERSKTRKAKKHVLIQKARRKVAQALFAKEMWFLKHPKKEQRND